MKKQEYLQLDAVAMAALVKSKDVAPKELTEMAFQIMDEVNPVLNAIIHTRKEQALAEADRASLVQAPFAGVPILMKGISQNVEGEPMSSGSSLLQGNIAKADSYFVKAFRDAGFQFLGHTNTPEFGLKNITEPKAYGPTRNPWNPAHSPGGSSGGAAAVVASGIVPMAGASDGGGSIRIPASFTGLFGLKPTRGRTPVGPGYGRQWQGAAINFVLSRSVRDSAGMLDVLQTVQPEAAFQTPLYSGSYAESMKGEWRRPLRIAFSTASPVGTHVSKDAITAVRKMVNWLLAEGHEVEELDSPVDGIELMKAYYTMNSGEMNATVRSLEKAVGRKLTSRDLEIESWMLHKAGELVTAADYSDSLHIWDLAAEKMANFHRSYDFYVTPATAHTAPGIGELTPSEERCQYLLDQLDGKSKEGLQQVIYDMFLPSLTYTPHTQLANLTGQPAMSLPLHLSDEGLPLGVQVMAQKGEEHLLLRLAHQLEQSDLWVGMKGNPLFDR